MRRVLSYILKSGIIASAVIGVGFSVLRASTPAAKASLFMYFTTQSNIVMAIVALMCLVGMARLHSDSACLGRFLSLCSLMSTVAITVTGVVFCFVLAPTMGHPFANESIYVHVFTPILSVADYILCRRYLRLKASDCLYGIVLPLSYLGYASLGYVLDWSFNSRGLNYPYFFMNWGNPLGAFGLDDAFPFMGVMWYILAILVFVILISRLYIWRPSYS